MIRKKMTLSMTAASIAMLAMSTAAHAAVMYDFGTMNTVGSGSTGWSFGGAAGSGGGNHGNPDAPHFFIQMGASATGTSDGDLLAAGDYTISFTYTPTVDSSGVEALLFTIYAWDGSTQTSLASLNPTDPAEDDWTSFDISFTVPTGSGVIGQQLQFDVRTAPEGSGGGYAGFDSITGEFTPIPEPASLALLGLGGLLIVRRGK